MKIFINDIPVRIIDDQQITTIDQFDVVIDGSLQKVSPKKLIDDVLINEASQGKVEELLQLMTDNKLKELDSITFANRKKEDLIKFIKRKFNVVEAAGGVVDKEGMTLAIFRSGRWDLPKGKLDKGEDKKTCALREVFEETGVKAKLGPKITATYHTYTRNKKYVLKKTHWYAMHCVDDVQMGPQHEEDIEKVQWMTLTELRSALYGSYRSIRYVIQEYHKLLKLQNQRL